MWLWTAPILGNWNTMSLIYQVWRTRHTTSASKDNKAHSNQYSKTMTRSVLRTRMWERIAKKKTMYQFREWWQQMNIKQIQLHFGWWNLSIYHYHHSLHHKSDSNRYFMEIPASSARKRFRYKWPGFLLLTFNIFSRQREYLWGYCIEVAVYIMGWSVNLNQNSNN